MRGKILYIDKANSIDEIRIAEKSIWVEQFPIHDYRVDYLLVQNSVAEVESNACEIIPYSKIKMYSFLVFIFTLLRYIRRERPNYLVIRNVVDLGIVAYMYTLIFKIEIIYIKAFPYLEFKRNRASGIRKKMIDWLINIEIFLMKKVDFLIVRSEKFKNVLEQKYNLKRNDIIIIPMGINTDMIHRVSYDKKQKLKDEYGITKEFCGLYFGALDKSRNIDFIIEAIGETQKNNANFTFLIVGGNPKDIQNLREVAKTYNAEITFISSLKREKLFELIQVVDFSISVIPPIEEYILSSPTKVLESLGLGCPVIVNEEIDDQKNIIQECLGGFIIKYSKEDVCRVLEEILSGKHDLVSIGNNGKEYVLNNRSYSSMTTTIIKRL